MKRFLPIPVLCSAALLAVLCACTPDSASTATDTLSDTAQPFTEEAAAPAEKVTQPVATGFVNLNRADQTMMGSGSDTGFYQILYRPDNSANLTYVDYATAQEIFLCASPNCTHDNESCSAWLPPEDLSCVPLVVGDRLLLFDRISFSGGAEGQAHPMRLFSAGLDGSGRKLLTEFDGSESCFSVISANETMLVMQVTRADEQGAATGQTLVSVNLDTGERSDFYPIPQGQNVQFAGVTENGYCVLYSVQETLSEEDFQGEDWGETSAVMDSGKVYTWSVVPVGGSRQETVCQRSGDLQFLVADDGLYTFDCNTGELYYISLPDGTEKLLATIAQGEEQEPYASYFDRKLGDWVVFSVSCYLDGTDADGNRNCGDFCYAVNTATGEQKQITLQYSYFGEARSFSSLASTDTDVFLITNTQGGDNLHYGYTFGLMPITDYIHSNAEALRPVTMMPDLG